jgi:predicted N-acetyltransferase YhbS
LSTNGPGTVAEHEASKAQSRREKKEPSFFAASGPPPEGAVGMSAHGLMIRELHESEYAAAGQIVAASVRALWAEVYPAAVIETVAEQNTAEWIAKRSARQADYLAESGGRPVGYAAVMRAEIGHLFVRPDTTGRGVGGALVAFCEEAIRRNGYETAKVFASLPAVGFYERRGFRRVGEESFELRPGVMLDSVRMEKRI